MTEQATVYGGTWRYMAVHELVKIHTGTYWNVLVLMVQSGYAFLLDLLLQFCPAKSAVLETSVSVLETSVSNHTNASSSMFQSTAAPAASFVTSPALFGGGRWLL